MLQSYARMTLRLLYNSAKSLHLGAASVIYADDFHAQRVERAAHSLDTMVADHILDDQFHVGKVNEKNPEWQ